MSTLWTPGGEYPVDRDRPPADAPEAGAEAADARAATPEDTPEDAAMRAEYERMQQQVLDAPAGDVVAQHVMSLYELAAVHLSQERPRLDDARLVIDAVTAVVDALAGRLGPAEGPLKEALPQLRMAYVEAADRVRQESPD